MPACVRFTFYPSDPRERPTTMAAPEESYRDSVGDVQPPESVFCVKDVYECDSDDLVQITAMAHGRQLASFEHERNMAIAYYWAVGHFRLLKPGGVLVYGECPLTVDELRYVQEQAARHPSYDRYVFHWVASDGTLVAYPRLES